MTAKQRIFVTILFFGIFYLALQFATQYVASVFNYDPALAEEASVIYQGDGFAIYQPLAFVSWFFTFHDYDPEVFKTALRFFYAGAIICCLALIICKNTLYKKNNGIFGSARFADAKDIAEMGMFKAAGIFIGVLKGRFLRDDSETHLMMIAGSRAGKGVGSIIPTSITWPGSMIFTDIKGELWNITSGCRKYFLKNYVFKFQPNTLDSCHYNPLNEMRIRTEHEIADVDNLLGMLVKNQESSKSSDMAFWNESAIILIKAVVLFLLYTRQNASLPEVNKFLFGSSEYIWDSLSEIEKAQLEENKNNFLNAPVKLRLSYMRDFTGYDDKSKAWFKQYYNDLSGKHPIIVSCCNDMIGREEKQFSGILGNVGAILRVYQDPILAANMADSDFTITDLVDRDRPCSLYFVIPPSEISRLAPVTNLIIEMIFHRLTDESRLQYENYRGMPKSKHRLLMMLDEFPSFGHLGIMEKVLSYCAQFKIKCYLIAQNEKQIEEVYKANSSIYGNTDIKIYQTPNENKTAESISRALGKKTVTVASRGFGSAVFNPIGATSTNEHETGRELLTVDELRALDNNKEIIFVKGRPPVLCEKFRFYEQPRMMARLSHPPLHSDSFYKEKEANEAEASETPMTAEQAKELLRQSDSIELNNYSG